ncbi:hypothetical protein [Actinocrispum wychmicini]|uniref:Uncharacterized protein n=1 Tax=Actinocrispum wychmicini TaxID=1213861 RepID=A0A4V2S7M1_9PSEU|nr:hypothetical protein [Actinocrispum wychmicini]TCO60540.1 hypothetical protein EV192_103115 [Actinocrispum wychmicini]
MAGWQAEYMVSGMRDQVLSLACLRHGVPAVQGRGVDDLPEAVLASFGGTRPGSLEPAELARAFAVTMEGLLVEAEFVDAELADRIRPTLRNMVLGVSQEK